MKMTREEENIVAIHESIEKWTGICEEGRQDKGGYDCALCTLVFVERGETCEQCPLCEVGKACDEPDSPYNKFRRVSIDMGATDGPSLLAATAMKQALIDLLPEDITITFTPEEVQLIMDVVGSAIGGGPYREINDQIYDKLKKDHGVNCGFQYWNKFTETIVYRG